MQDYRSRSFWLSGDEYTASPAFTGDLDVDVAIIGGGYTGLSTAYHLKKQEPGIKVALLEGEVIGFGASGRNAGFSMTLFGMTLAVTRLRFGRAKALEAHRYMERAVDLLQQMVQENQIDCDYEHPGFLRVATSPAYARRIQEEIELAQALGIEGIEWLGQTQLAEQVRSPQFLGAWWEPRCGLVNPAKLARGMKQVVESQGVLVFEDTPVTSIDRGDKITLQCAGGQVRADKVVLATNAYSNFVPGMQRKQVPIFTHIVLSEPLRDEQLAEIGWHNRQGLEDARNLVHYYRLTADNRLLMGGRTISIPFGDQMELDHHQPTFDSLQQDVRDIFPSLRDLRFTHSWGGPVSVPVDMAPAIGFLGDERVVYSMGCVGHGVSLAQLNGWTLADLMLEQKTERTEVFFVRRRTIPWPPEPFRFALAKAIKGALDLQDVFTDPRDGAGRRPSA